MDESEMNEYDEHIVNNFITLTSPKNRERSGSNHFKFNIKEKNNTQARFRDSGDTHWCKNKKDQRIQFFNLKNNLINNIKDIKEESERER